MSSLALPSRSVLGAYRPLTSRLLARRYDLQPLTSVSQWTPECAAKVICGVGAIPSFEPVTEGERNVYALAREVFGSWPEQAQGGGKEKRLFMEMCYKVSRRRAWREGGGRRPPSRADAGAVR